MLSNADLKERFLTKFTEELLSNVKEEQQEKEKERLKKEELKKRIGIEKLKSKYSEYKKSVQPIKIEQRPRLPIPTSNSHQQKNNFLPPSMSLENQPKPVAPPNINVQKQQFGQTERIMQVKPILFPAQTAIGEINLGKLSSLTQDRLITSIECLGEGKNIIIRKAGNIIKTQLNLTKQEIDSLVHSFSERTRIPIMEGLLRARSDNLEISAVLSENSPSTFIITKDIIPQMNMNPRPNQLRKPTQFISNNLNIRAMENPQNQDKNFWEKKPTIG